MKCIVTKTSCHSTFTPIIPEPSMKHFLLSRVKYDLDDEAKTGASLTLGNLHISYQKYVGGEKPTPCKAQKIQEQLQVAAEEMFGVINWQCRGWRGIRLATVREQVLTQKRLRKEDSAFAEEVMKTNCNVIQLNEISGLKHQLKDVKQENDCLKQAVVDATKKNPDFLGNVLLKECRDIVLRAVSAEQECVKLKRRCDYIDTRRKKYKQCYNNVLGVLKAVKSPSSSGPSNRARETDADTDVEEEISKTLPKNPRNPKANMDEQAIHDNFVKECAALEKKISSTGIRIVDNVDPNPGTPKRQRREPTRVIELTPFDPVIDKEFAKLLADMKK